MNCHTTILEILNTLILSFCWSLKKHMQTPLDLFLTFLMQQKFNRRDSSNPVVLIKFYFYLITTPKIQIQHTFQYSKKSSNLVFLHHQKTCLHFFSLHQIYSSSPHLFASPKSSCQSSCRNMIHKTHEKFSLNN